MEYVSYTDIVHRLQSSLRIRGIFATGTTASTLTPSSDIDLVVIVDKNVEEIKSIYTMIENRFADIFFFDVAFLEQLENVSEISGNGFDGMFVTWLQKGKIEYDPDGILERLKEKITSDFPKQHVDDEEKQRLWVQVNYNYIANVRYHRSHEELYHRALEIRLLYSVVELITAYFSFRDVPWRGEKEALKYVRVHDEETYNSIESYMQSGTLEEKMVWYRRLFERVLTDQYQEWKDGFVVPVSSKSGLYQKDLEKFWKDISLGDTLTP